MRTPKTLPIFVLCVIIVFATAVPRLWAQQEITTLDSVPKASAFTFFGYSYRWLDNIALNKALEQAGYQGLRGGVLDIFLSSNIYFPSGVVFKTDFSGGFAPAGRQTNGDKSFITTMIQGAVSSNVGYSFIASDAFRLFATVGLESQIRWLNLVQRPIETDFVQTIRSTEPEIARNFWISRFNIPVMICTEIKALTFNMETIYKNMFSLSYYIHLALGYVIGFSDAAPISGMQNAPNLPSSGPIARFSFGFNSSDIERQALEAMKKRN